LRRRFFYTALRWFYGASGSTNLAQIASAAASSNLLRLGLTLDPVGLGFKVAAAPFQVWTPTFTKARPHRLALFSAGRRRRRFALPAADFHTFIGTDFWFLGVLDSRVVTMFVGNLGHGANQREAHAGV